MAYQQAWKLQDQLAIEIGMGLRPATLLLVEHPPTYTFGRSGKESNLLWDKAELSRRGIQTFWVDRGGDVTYHGPGQLVGYPLLPLNPGGLQASLPAGRLPQADYLGYLRRLETTLILALAKVDISSRTINGLTGVWVDQPYPGHSDNPGLAKIAAIGVKVDAMGVSRHGFALNVDLNMEPWQGIIPCGIENCQVTCIAELVSPCPAIEVMKGKVTEAFAQVFNFELGSV